ncbi:Zinc finger HIT domain-containing protein 3 [Sparganum proliferum]
MSESAEGVCEVCNAREWKYKCSKCLLRHCSLNCYKLHKDAEGCQRSPPLPPLDTLGDEELANRVPLDLGDDSSDYVPTRLLERLRDSERLKELLHNKHLRDYLTALDCSRHPARAIEKAMKEPLFVEFADECLRILDPSFETPPEC